MSHRTLTSFLRFVGVGVLNTLTHYAIYLPLRLVIPYVVAHVIAWFGAIITSFVLNCRWTFGVAPTWRRAISYPLSSLPNLAMTTVGVVALVQWLGVDQRLAPLLAGLGAVPVTFLVGRWLLVDNPLVRTPAERLAEDVEPDPERSPG